MAARIGGEEFVLRLPGEVDAPTRAEGLRAVVAAGSPAFSFPFPVTVSIGVARGREDELPELLSAADIALYQAKRTGRNRVVVAGAELRAAPAPAAAGPERRAHRGQR